MTQQWKVAIIVSLLAIEGLLQGPALLARLLSNFGMLAFRNALFLEMPEPVPDRQSGAYPLYQTLSTSDAQSQVSLFRRAIALDHDSVAIRWGLGRQALAVGDAPAAAKALKPIVDWVKRNPLLYQDAWIAFSYGQMPHQVIVLCESFPPQRRTKVMSDTMAVAYLEMEGRGALEEVGWLRPGDLYVNYHLWQEAQRAGDLTSAAAYRGMLVNFPLGAISPTDERLLDYVADVVPDLLEEGLWHRDKTLNVISFLVWQHNGAPGVERLLERLIERYPAEPDWPFYLAKLYHGRGDLERAEAAYHQVLTVDPEYVQAYLRLGMLNESRIGEPVSDRWLEEAARWYEQYHGMIPYDLLAFKRLAEVCAALEDEDDESCRRAAERVMEERGSGGAGQRGSEGEGGIRDSQFATRDSPAAVLWAGWLERVAAASPEHFAGQEFDSGWTFLGYDVDEARLIRGEPVDLLLYWVGPVSASAGPEQDGWYEAGERWVQVLEGAQNLVLNGGFELGMEGESPAGFPWDIYHADPGTRRLVADFRAVQATTTALLGNTEVYSNTSFASTWVPINPDRLYLQAAWIKSAGGNGYLGRHWAGDIAEGVRPYDYVAKEVRVDDWQHYAGVTWPLEGATRCQIWLLNWRATGRVYFDNVLFVEVGLPGK